MGHWNYRICRKQVRSEHQEAPIYFYGIYEVYYNADGSIWATTETPVSLGCDRFTDDPTETEEWAVQEILGGLDKMLAGAQKEILDLDTIVFTPQPDEEDE